MIYNIKNIKTLWSVIIICLVGIIYYSLYYNYGFNVADEGSAGLITKFLLEGKVPGKDIALGYNIGWFLPIVGIFKVFGVKFIYLKLYFFLLALTTGISLFFVISKLIKNNSIALLAALYVILIPGTIHKAYIPLIVVVNLLSIIFLVNSTRHNFYRNFLISLFVNFLSLSIRVELGIVFLLFLLIVTIIRYLFRDKSNTSYKEISLKKFLLVVFSSFLIVYLPVLLFLNKNRFLNELFIKGSNRITSLFHFLNFNGPFVEHSSVVAKGMEKPYLSRIPILESGKLNSFGILTYLPIVIVIVFFIVMIIRFTKQYRSRSLDMDLFLTESTVVMASLSAFPQFFLFRPDMPHLSQFMPGFLVLLVYILTCIFRFANKYSQKIILKRVYIFSFSLPIVLYLIIYFYSAMTQPGAGTIFARKNRSQPLKGSNGIDVVVSPGEHQIYTKIMQIVHKYTTADDFVVCFPYCPGINLITNRNTYQRKLYVDDAHLRFPHKIDMIIKKIRLHKPAIVIYTNWAINGTKQSMFKNWAKKIVRHLAAHYSYFGDVHGYHVYIRPNKLK